MKTAGTLLLGALLGAGVTAGAFLLAGSRPDAVPAGDDAAGAARTAAAPAAGDAAARGRGAADVSGGLRSAAAPPTPAEHEFLGAALREERRRREAAVIRPEDAGLDVLYRVFDEKADPASLLEAFGRIEAHVVRADGPVATFPGGKDVTRLRPGDLKKAVVIELGPGLFVFDEGWPRWGASVKGADVESLEIRGAGSSRTTVRGPGGSLLFVDTRLKSLRLRGFTWEGGANGNRFAQVDGDLAAVVEDCRFVGDGERGSIHFYVSGRSLLAFRDCTFEGRSATFSPPLTLNGDAVALFERCAFLDVAPAVGLAAGAVREGALKFVDCRFEGTPLLAYATYRGHPAVAVHVAGGRVAYGSPQASENERRRQWGAGLTATLEGVDFTPDPVWPTVGSALDVLERLRPLGDQRPLGVHLVCPERGERASVWNVDLWDPSVHAVNRAKARGKAGVLTIGPTEGGSNVNAPLGDEQRASIDWRGALTAGGVPLDDDARGLVLSGANTPPPDPRWVPVIQVEAPKWPQWQIEIPSGRVLSKPER